MNAYYVFAIGKAEEMRLPHKTAVALSAVQAGELVAFVSQVPLSEFSEEALRERVQDPVWLERMVLLHQTVMNALLAEQSILPLRFGTIYHDETRVQQWLAEQQQAYLAKLAQVTGCREWGVKLYANSALVAAHVTGANERIATLNAQIASKAAGAAYLLQKQRDRLLATEIEAMCDRFAQHCHTTLSESIRASQINALSPASDATEIALSNIAYLSTSTAGHTSAPAGAHYASN
ncbi:hypothetical protein HC891_23480 [Candidatus Gracilibacteria bacterium]|nr:hypothetical protein [Candidatus Gracilibacteria bacterium]